MPSVPLRWVLLPDPQGAFATQALLSTEPDATPERILAWFVLRWQPEVTFEEARRHLGVETQRQWSEVAIRRTTPALFGLFSLVTLHALQQTEQTPTPVRQAAWYPKRQRVPAAAGASPTRWRWCAANSGPTRVLRCPLATPMW